jgi:histidinol-phosphate aminotransferase
MTANFSRRDLLGISGALAAGAALGPLPGTVAAQMPASAALRSNAVRLGFNENPYGPGPAARAAIQAAIADAWKYPVPEEMELRAMIAAREGLTPRHVLIGDGSSEILHVAAVLQAHGGGELLTAAPTFSMAAEHVRASGGTVREVPLDAGMRFDLAAMRAAISPATRLIYVCNPNNPTGTLVPGAELRAFLDAVPREVTVLVDEAYLELASDLAEHSAVSHVKKDANVIVARTFSKLHGLAGLRVGYALARPDLVERMTRLKLTVASNLGLVAAAASYADLEFQETSRRRIAEGVAITIAALDELKLRHAPTRANFVFFDTGEPIAGFIAAMRQKGFAVGRPFPPYATWCRVSMGTVEQMRAFAAALRAHYQARGAEAPAG